MWCHLTWTLFTAFHTADRTGFSLSTCFAILKIWSWFSFCPSHQPNPSCTPAYPILILCITIHITSKNTTSTIEISLTTWKNKFQILFFLITLTWGTGIVSTAPSQLVCQANRQNSHWHNPRSPQFYAECPSCRSPHNISGLGTGIGFCWF